MGTAVILPDLILPSRVNERWLCSGIDSLKSCRNKQHFQNYPYTVDYVYNSRGFRDQEWPHSELELRDAIWCIGDSFTVGLGQPVAHIWPQVLATATGRRCINISMDGASNDWIWRRTQDIYTAIQPRNMVIMWSYTHRSELQDCSLDDEQRRLQLIDRSDQDSLCHLTDLVNKVHDMNCDTVQCTIPDFHPIINREEMLHANWRDIKGQDWPACPTDVAALESLPDWIIYRLQNVHYCYTSMKCMLQPRGLEYLQSVAILQDVIHVTKRLDWARDHHHFDILTAQWVVDQIMPRLCA